MWYEVLYPDGEKSRFTKPGSSANLSQNSSTHGLRVVKMRGFGPDGRNLTKNYRQAKPETTRNTAPMISLGSMPIIRKTLFLLSTLIVLLLNSKG